MSAAERERDPEAGLTMVEIMVSVLLVSIAAAFVFSIQMRTSNALRDQQAIAEMQQTLRSASDQIVRDLRSSGYLARSVQVGRPGGTCTVDGTNILSIPGVGVVNSSTGSDLLRVVYADTSSLTLLTAPWTADESTVNSTAGFATDDMVLLVSTDAGTTPSTYGLGCVLQLTGVDPGNNKLLHAGGSGPNLAGNCQCNNIGLASRLAITRVNLHAYRIRPADVRGILEMSPSAGLANPEDWTAMAVGVVDLQIALRVFQPGDATDEDGDGDPLRDWFSGSNMGFILFPPNVANRLLAVSATLEAKTTKEVNGVVLAQTPDLFDPAAPLNNNRIGDRAGLTLPVTDTASMYYGDFVYRSYSSTVDMRNVANQ